MNAKQNAIVSPKLFRLGFLSDKSTNDRILQGLTPQVVSNLCVYNYIPENGINFSNCNSDKLGPLSLVFDDVCV